MTLHDFARAAAERLEHVPGWQIAALGGAVATPALLTPMGDGLDARSIVHGLGTVLGTLALLWPAIRAMVRKSDKKTEAVGQAVRHEVVEAIRTDLERFRSDQTIRNQAVSQLGPRLVSIDSNLRDVADVRSEMTGMAFQVGEISTTVSRLKGDVDALHHWKREHVEEHKKGDALLKLWGEEVRRRKTGEGVTPPHGWSGPTGGKTP